MGEIISNYFKKNKFKWNVNLIKTGINTMTGGRLKRVAQYLENEECFCFTYGDGLSDINISHLVKFHKQHGKKATLTATRPQGRYGALKFGRNEIVSSFQEKPDGDGSWINGGFFVLSPSVLDIIENDQTIWELDSLPLLAKSNELYAFKHRGFWQPMDTLREKTILNKLCESGNAPWKVW